MPDASRIPAMKNLCCNEARSALEHFWRNASILSASRASSPPEPFSKSKYVLKSHPARIRAGADAAKSTKRVAVGVFMVVMASVL